MVSVVDAVAVELVVVVVIGITAPRIEDARVRATVKRANEDNMLLQRLG